MKNEKIEAAYLEKRATDNFKVVRFKTEVDEQGYFGHSFDNLYTKVRCSIEAVLDSKKMTVIFNNGVFFTGINSEENRIITNETILELRLQNTRYKGNDIYRGQYVDVGGEMVQVQMRIKPKR